MNNHTAGRAHCEAAALPENHINLAAMSLADKTTLAFLLLESMAADWKKAGVRTQPHHLPIPITQGTDQIGIQCFDVPAHSCCDKPARRIPCLLGVELVDVDHLREILEQERRQDVGKAGIAHLRSLFKGEGIEHE